jgi:hypothetical protein
MCANSHTSFKHFSTRRLCPFTGEREHCPKNNAHIAESHGYIHLWKGIYAAPGARAHGYRPSL